MKHIEFLKKCQNHWNLLYSRYVFLLLVRFTLFCQYISLILRVHFPYSAGTFPLFCRFIFLIMLVHFLICRNIFFFVGAFPLCHNCNLQLIFIYVPSYHVHIFSFSLGTLFILPFIHSKTILL